MPLNFLRRHGWWLLLLASVGFVVWTNSARIRRIEYVTNVGREYPAPTFPAAAEFRHLIVPGHINASYRWIAETQEMFARGQVRVRHTAAENAPFGREVHSASLYRWWLGLMTKFVQATSDRPLIAAIERAALLADPALHVLFLVVTSTLVARWFGPAAASISIIAATWLFPLGAGFLPGVPDDFSVLLIFAPWSILPLLVGIQGRAAADPISSRPRNHPHRWFFAAGCFGALGLWLSVAGQTPVLLGIALGGIVAAVSERRAGAATLPPDAWRAWGAGGALTVLLAYLLEYAPSHLGGWEFRAVHPMYAVAWLGGAEVLARVVAWIQTSQRPRGARAFTAIALGLAGAASLPIAMWRRGNLGFLNVDLLSFRLTKQTDGVHAANLLDWISRDGVTPTVLATLAPLLLLALGAWLAFRRGTPPAVRAGLALSLGCLLIPFVLAGFQLRWWQTAEALALPAWIATLSAIAAAPRALASRVAWTGGFGAAALLGVAQLLPLKELRGQNVLTLAEVEGLVERDLAHSLARRVAHGRDAIVLAPPSVSGALNYYAGIRGLSSLAWENKAGLSVALRIVIATSREEAHSLVENRGVTHLLVPSWDPFFDTFIQAASVQSGELLFTSLQRWVIPMWLRPIPHELPAIPGFAHHRLSVFEVVAEQEPAIGMSRVADYFVEMGQLDAAKAAGEALRRYPADFSALVAQANLEAARNDGAAFTASLTTITRRLEARGDRLLPWDRRVSLAVVLARGQRHDLARAQLERCVRDATLERVRALTPQALFHFLYLAKLQNIAFPDPAVRDVAVQLLPASSRARL